MKGNVLGFDPDTNTGAISGHDGQRYDFVRRDWRGETVPRRGDIVDFQAIERRATEIYLVEPVYVQPSLAAFYFSPQGRISRSQYWLRFVLPYTVIVVVLETIIAAVGADSAAGISFAAILSLFSLVAFWPSVAILVKRMHDRNKSGWLILILVIPAVLFAILLMVWLIGAAALVIGVDQAVTAIPALSVLGVVVIVLGVITLCVDIWVFIEFGCLRGTVGPNRFGPNPVRPR